MLSALSGRWAGVLEYRDYGEPADSSNRIRLPTWLAVSTDRRGTAIFGYTYDDGPAKIVTESTLVQFDVHAGTMTTIAEKSSEKEINLVEGYRQLINGRGVLVALGRRMESGLPVETRTTWIIQRDLLESTLETRLAGGNYSFRHAYIFTRNLPPPATGEAALSSAR